MKKIAILPGVMFGLAMLMQITVHLACAQDAPQTAKAANSSYVRPINGADAFDAAVAAAGDTLVMVDLYADWCGPCQRLSPLLEEVAKEKQDRVITLKVNVDNNRDLAMRYKVRSIPYVVFIKKGEMVKSLLGLREKSAYTGVIDSMAPDSGD